MRLLYYNSEFVENIAKKETQNAFKLYHTDHSHNLLPINASSIIDSVEFADIVIHYRCGDLLSRRTDDLYGLLSISFYVKALEIILGNYPRKIVKNIWIKRSSYVN